MVALLTPESLTTTPVFPVFPVLADRTRPRKVAAGHSQDARPALRLIQGGLDVKPRVDTRLAALVVGVALAVAAIVGIRMGQAVPVGDIGTMQQSATPVPVALGDASGFVTVQIGQNMWDVARLVAPEADPRITVSVLADANGGVNVVAGQKVLVPTSLAS